MPTLAGGGAEKVLYDILSHFDYARYEVTLLLDYRRGVYYDLLPQEVEVIAKEDFNGKHLKYIVNRHTAKFWDKYVFTRFLVNKYTISFWDRYVLAKLLGNRCFDTIISFMEGDAVYTQALIAGRGRKNISWIHIDLLHHHWSKNCFHKGINELDTYNCMDQIIFVSQNAASQAQRLWDYKLKAPCKVIENPIDRKSIIEKASLSVNVPRKKRFTLINIGRLSAQKRHDRLIDAISILHHRNIDVDLWILGTGPDEEKLRNRIAELNLEEQVSLLGFQKNPYPFLAQADLYVSSSSTEGYPLVIAEALCLGKPIIATNVTGNSDILDGGNGILVDETPEAIADAISLLYNDKSALEKFAMASARAGEKYNIDEWMDSIYKLIN